MFRNDDGKEYKLVRFISDLHIGDKSLSDDFGAAQAYMLEDLIRDTRDKGGLLVVVGDMMELWQAPIYNIVSRYGFLFELIGKVDHIIVSGNHDFQLTKLYGFNGFQCYPTVHIHDTILIHGHQFDIYNDEGVRTGKIVARIIGWLERGYPDIDLFLDTAYVKYRRYIPPWKSPVNYSVECAKYAKDAGEYIKTIIFGHTHIPGMWHYSGVTVYNCGTWVNGRRDYLEYRDGEYGLLEWRK